METPRTYACAGHPVARNVGTHQSCSHFLSSSSDGTWPILIPISQAPVPPAPVSPAPESSAPFLPAPITLAPTPTPPVIFVHSVSKQNKRDQVVWRSSRDRPVVGKE